MGSQMTDDQLKAVFKALADARRLAIVHMLERGGEVCACSLLDGLDISQPTLSHHMKVLCDSGLVRLIVSSVYRMPAKSAAASAALTTASVNRRRCAKSGKAAVISGMPRCCSGLSWRNTCIMFSALTVMNSVLKLSVPPGWNFNTLYEKGFPKMSNVMPSTRLSSLVNSSSVTRSASMS